MEDSKTNNEDEVMDLGYDTENLLPSDQDIDDETIHSDNGIEAK